MRTIVFILGLCGTHATRTEEGTAFLLLDADEKAPKCSTIADSAKNAAKKAEAAFNTAYDAADRAKDEVTKATEALEKLKKTAAEKEKIAGLAEDAYVKSEDLVIKMKGHGDTCVGCRPWKYDYRTLKCNRIKSGDYYIKNTFFNDYLHCNNGGIQHVDKSSKFTVSVSGMTVKFKNKATGKYVKAIDNGGGGAACDMGAPGSWETFTIVPLDDMTFAFKTSRGYYLRAVHGDGEKKMDVEPNSIGTQERFTLET